MTPKFRTKIYTTPGTEVVKILEMPFALDKKIGEEFNIEMAPIGTPELYPFRVNRREDTVTCLGNGLLIELYVHRVGEIKELDAFLN